MIRAKARTMEHLGLKDEIEDMLITLGSQYHLIRLLTGRGGNGLFLYLVLDKAKSIWRWPGTSSSASRRSWRSRRAAVRALAHP